MNYHYGMFLQRLMAKLLGQIFTKVRLERALPNAPILIGETFVNILETLNDLSSDQGYLRDIILGINNNDISSSLEKRSPGKLGYARWLTVANRILRYYVSVVDPTENLILIVNFVIKVYARSWFNIKSKPIFIYSPHHIFNMIKYIDDINNDCVTNICHKVIQQNAY